MDQHNEGRKKFMEFPYVSVPHKTLMCDLVSMVETRLDTQLQPCTLPPDVQYYQSPSGSAEATLQIRTGRESSSTIDLILASWLHSELPTGGALNITSLTGYLNSSTDAPNFLLEFIQMSPESLVLIIDWLPRKDLVLYPEYLQTFYEDTNLDSHRQILEKLPEVQPYFSSSLYIRCVTSPTAIMVSINAEPERMEEIVKDHVDSVAKEVLGMWIDQCACRSREVVEEDKASLEKRDRMVRKKSVDIDLGSSFPKWFGPQVASRVLGVLQQVFRL